MISLSQRPLPDNSQQTNIYAAGGIRTHDLSRRAAADLRIRPRGHWDRHINTLALLKFGVSWCSQVAVTFTIGLEIVTH